MPYIFRSSFIAALVALVAVATMLFGMFALSGCQRGSNQQSSQNEQSQNYQSDNQQDNNKSNSSQDNKNSNSTDNRNSSATTIDRNGSYTSKKDVALYIHTYGKLPGNFISKTKARKAGWVPSKGNLQTVCPGKSIGGSVFYNDDRKLPDAKGRTWYECDIDYHGGTRNAKRIVFSNDGLIYYTGNHYKSFERLY